MPYKRVTFTHAGKRYERKGRTLAEAHAKAAALKEQLKRGEIALSGSMTVAAWADTWLETYKRPVIGEGQYKNYRALISTAILPALGSQRLCDVRDVQLQQMLNARAADHGRADLSHLRMTLRAMFRQAAASRLISYSPAEYLVLPAITNTPRRGLTDDERRIILALADTHRAGLWIKLTLYCGIRPGEARALVWSDVDFDAGLLRVRQSVKSKTRDVGAPKSAAGLRDVPIPDVLLQELRKLAKDREMPVLARSDNSRHTETSLRRWWLSFRRELDIMLGAELHRNKIIKSAVAPDLVPYCLRHTYCTDLQDAGVPINVAKYLMGHSDISVTSKIYTHTTDRAITDAADKINKANVAISVAQT
jgi:integrase